MTVTLLGCKANRIVLHGGGSDWLKTRERTITKRCLNTNLNVFHCYLILRGNKLESVLVYWSVRIVGSHWSKNDKMREF